MLSNANASVDGNKRREIASKWGKAAHQKGTAHEWTVEEAREAHDSGCWCRRDIRWPVRPARIAGERPADPARHFAKCHHVSSAVTIFRHDMSPV